MSAKARQRARLIFGRSIAVLSCLALLLIGLALFLLSSQRGSVWLVNQLTGLLNQQPGLSLTIGRMEGTLFRGMTLSELAVSNESGGVSIAGVATQWNPYSLLSGNIYLSRLDITGLIVKLPPSQEAGQEEAFELLWPDKELLPIPLEIADITISDIQLTQESTDSIIDELRLAVRLSGRDLDIHELLVSAFDMQLQGDLQLTMTESMPLAGSLSWRFFGETPLPYTDYAGELTLRGDLQALQIEHQLRLPQSITSSGSIVPGLFDAPLAFQLQHSLESIELPFQAIESYVIGNSTIATTGNLERVSIELTSEVSTPALPVVRLTASADYSENTLSVEAFNLGLNDSSLNGTGSIDWVDSVTATGNFSMTSPSPLDYVEVELPLDLSQLAIDGTFSVAQQNELLLGTLSVDNLTGQMGSYPVAGSGVIALAEEGLDLQRIELYSASNHLSLDGIIADDISLTWNLQAPVLEEFFTGLSGGLQGSGTAQGEAATLDVSGLLSGSNLRYGPLSLDEVDLNLEKLGEYLSGAVRVDRLSYIDGSSNESFSDMRLDINGTVGAHDIAFSTESSYGEINLALQGGLASSNDLNWSGLLRGGSVSTPIGPWTSSDFANLEIGGNSLALGSSCWTQDEARICIEVSPQQAGGYHIDTELRGYPLTVFNTPATGATQLGDDTAIFPRLPSGSRVEGHIEGEMAARFDPGQAIQVGFDVRSADASLVITPELSPDSLDLEEEPEEQVYRVDLFELTGQVESGAVEIGLVSSFVREGLEDSNLDLTGETSVQLSVSSDQRLDGTVTIAMDDIRWLEAMLPELSNISGAIQSSVNIAGTVSDPEVTGTVNVIDGSLTLESMGLSLSGISTQVTSTNSTSAHFAGGATSGNGEVSFEGTVSDPLDATRTVSARIKGDSFQLANTPDLKIELSPDVVIAADAKSFDVQGSLELATLALTLQRLPESSVDVSRDAVIVNYPADRPELARSDSAVNTLLFDIPISGQVNITLGEQVSFSGFGLEAKLGGSLEVAQSANGGNLTYGELTIESGKYEMYGQTLEVRQGKLLFFGAYDNPAIDIRAVREVENQTVGVLMNGTLKSMRSQLFSTPALADNDIIAVIATGRPFSQVGAQDSDAMLGAIARLGLERGQGITNQVRDKLGLDALAIENTGNINNSVLTIGKYLTPEIFVRYGIGLFDSRPKVAIDYTLSERIKLKAESGEYQSVDITYTVEN